MEHMSPMRILNNRQVFYRILIIEQEKFLGEIHVINVKCTTFFF